MFSVFLTFCICHEHTYTFCVLYMSWSHPDIYVTCVVHVMITSRHIHHRCCMCHEHSPTYTLHVCDTPNTTCNFFSCLIMLGHKNVMIMKIMHLMRSQQTRKEHMKKSSIEHNYLRIATLMLGFHQRSHCFISRAMKLKGHQTHRTGEGEHVILICLIKHFR